MRWFVYSTQPGHIHPARVADINFEAGDEIEAQKMFAGWLYDDRGVWVFAHSISECENEAAARKLNINWRGPGYYDANTNFPVLLKAEALAGFSSWKVNGTNYFFRNHSAYRQL